MIVDEKKTIETCDHCGRRTNAIGRCVNEECPGKRECVHLLTMAWCAVCNGKAKQKEREERDAREELLLKPGWFVSKFPGKCGRCGTGFPIGEPIHRCEPEKGDLFFKYKGSCCAEER